MRNQNKIFQFKKRIITGIVFLLVLVLYGSSDINPNSPYAVAENMKDLPAEDIIMSLESQDSSIFMPVIRSLATLQEREDKQEILENRQVVEALKSILCKNQEIAKIKEPAIQALITVAGTSDTFDFLSGWNWNLQFYDNCRENWKDHWVLDGIKATINNTEKGMDFYAGPVASSDSFHSVLWTKEYFKDDLKIEYDFTRLDEQTKFVNIIYIQATGSGEGYLNKDILRWADKRESPAMSQYFGKMHLYHISYAAFTNVDGENKPGYIRARRYMANQLQGTEIEPDYLPGNFFKTNVKHHMKIIKTNRHLFMHISSFGEEKLCHWYNTEFPPITEGYVGLRHMGTRAARYAKYKISELVAH